MTLSRRTLLRGAGVAIALPWLEAMLPSTARAQVSAPKRFAALYFADGVLHAGAPNTNDNTWECVAQPSGAWTLSAALSPLQPFKRHLVYYNRLDPKDLRANGDGHWSSATSFLTGQRHTSNDEGGQFWLKAPGRSLDQAIAEKLGCAPLTMAPFPVTAMGPSTLGSRGVGGFCTNISWLAQKQVAPRFSRSADVFTALFGSANPSMPAPQTPTVDRRALGRKSVLDAVANDAQRLQAKLGTADRQRLDEYLTSVRAVEQRIQVTQEPVMPPPPTCPLPSAGPAAYANEVVNNRVHFDLGSKNMLDLMVLAFRCDVTRVSTLMLDYENDDRQSMSDLISGYTGPAAGADPHIVSHHTTEEHRQAMVRKNDWQVRKLLYLLQQLDAVTEPNGKTMLENSLVMFGSGMGDGNYHGGQFPGNGGGCARVTAGGLGGLVATDRFIDAGNRHHADLLAAIAQKFDVRDATGGPVSQWGFGTGVLPL